MEMVGEKVHQYISIIKRPFFNNSALKKAKNQQKLRSAMSELPSLR
ncbi:MAG: hypothetical protein ACJA0X_003013 [Cyclobacteriaceae bacterium]|jgi:hypothetical protein